MIGYKHPAEVRKLNQSGVYLKGVDGICELHARKWTHGKEQVLGI
jgi:hypothetical protein